MTATAKGRKVNVEHHVPDVAIKLGTVLDLTIAPSANVRTFIDDWDGWQLLSDENALERAPGRARLYLAPGEIDKLPIAELENFDVAAESYEGWADRDPDAVGELKHAHATHYYQGRVHRLGYRSDKWHRPGEWEDYDHDFGEGSPPKLYTDRAHLEDATLAIIVGGDFAVTEQGID